MMIERAFMTRSGLIGRDLANVLKERLKTDGLIASEPIQEDWGWALLIPFQGHQFTLSVSPIGDPMGRTPGEVRVGISYERMLNGLGAWFRRPPHGELSALGQVLENALRSVTQLQEVASV